MARRGESPDLIPQCSKTLMSLASDGYATRQRMRADAHRPAGMRQNHVPAAPAPRSVAPVLSGPPESLEQVRQGDGSDEQPAGEPRRAGRHPPQPAQRPEADAVEE